MLAKPVDAELAAFMASPVMIIIGTCDAAGRPEVARGCGALVRGDAGEVDIVVSGWLWPATLRNLATGGVAAATFARPADYVTYQVKGEATLAAPTPRHLDAARDYERDIRRVFAGLGLEKRLVDPWITQREPAVLRLAIAEVYVQTPGPRAGRAR
jgi:hypothetical protein